MDMATLKLIALHGKEQTGSAAAILENTFIHVMLQSCSMQKNRAKKHNTHITSSPFLRHSLNITSKNTSQQDPVLHGLSVNQLYKLMATSNTSALSVSNSMMQMSPKRGLRSEICGI